MYSYSNSVLVELADLDTQLHIGLNLHHPKFPHPQYLTYYSYWIFSINFSRHTIQKNFSVKVSFADVGRHSWGHWRFSQVDGTFFLLVGFALPDVVSIVSWAEDPTHNCSRSDADVPALVIHTMVYAYDVGLRYSRITSWLFQDYAPFISLPN